MYSDILYFFSIYFFTLIICCSGGAREGYRELQPLQSETSNPPLEETLGSCRSKFAKMTFTNYIFSLFSPL